MPIYEYKCTDCGHQFEKIQKMHDAPLADCPECDKSSLKKLISAAAFRLKGGGWYETDFKNSGQKNSGQKNGDQKTSEKTESSGAKSSKEKGASNA